MRYINLRLAYICTNARNKWKLWRTSIWVSPPFQIFGRPAPPVLRDRRTWFWHATIIFPDKEYLLSLIVASVDTLESRREHLSERFFRRSVLRESSCLHYLLPDKRDSTITDYVMRQHLHHSPLELKNFASHLYRTVWIFLTSTCSE